MAKLIKERAYDQRQRERGFHKICLWVPTADLDRIRAYAEKLRKAAEKSKAE